MVASTPNLKDEDQLAALSSRYVDIEALPWETGRWEGIRSKTLMEDPERGLKTALIEWSPGASLPFHEHVDIEQSYVLRGSLCDAEGECKAGEYVWRPVGNQHSAWSPNGCLLLAIFLKPNKTLEGPQAD
ncbi:MAG: cupin domain-containing protein [Alphaproteobacteria bacterium]